jgi:hypothetical protein
MNSLAACFWIYHLEQGFFEHIWEGKWLTHLSTAKHAITTPP